MLTLLAGLVSGQGVLAADRRDCRLDLPHGWEGVVEGRFLTRALPGRTVPFRPEAGLPGGCTQTVRALVGRGSGEPGAGVALRIPVRWEVRGEPVPGRGEWAGRLVALGEPVPVEGRDLRGRLLFLRGRIQETIAELWDDRAPMVEALVLARREHLDPELREAFALSGTAHLLAISGFHVGVVAGLLLGALRITGMGRRQATLGAVAGCWMYVLGIGAPHAAVRAALLLTLLAAARIRGRPVVPAGALASALLLLLVVDPGNLRSVGFQLSFAGTGGLVFLRGPLGSLVDRGWMRWRGERLVRGRKIRGMGQGLLKGGADGLIAGTAATLPTLPLLAWHFDRISLVGIPATLVVAPVVAMIIPGIGATLALAGPAAPLASFLSGGVDLLLLGVDRAVRWSAERPGASIWVSRPALLVSGGVGALVVLLLRWTLVGRVAPPVRYAAAAGLAAASVLLLPVLPGSDTLEVHLIDVGQGDALAVRFPSNRWILVDAGPRSDVFDAGSRRVVPYLRRRGVRRIEALVLTHPHLDHIGGAPAVLRDVSVVGVLDPSRPVPSTPWREVLEEGRRLGVSWWRAEEGLRLQLDDVVVEILHPDRATAGDPGLSDWNDLSVVVLVRRERGSALLTGDAYHWIEERVLPRLPARLSLLKVGHHGSRTSTGQALLDASEPAKAIIPVGSANRYGHPHPEVSQRLEARGTRTYRTDRDGDLRVRIERSGLVRVRTAR